MKVKIIIEFFMQMKKVPTVTHQEKKIRVVSGKPIVYEPQELKNTRQLLKYNLAKHIPESPVEGAIVLTTTWCFPVTGNHVDGEPKITKPDTDNLQKLLKDVMTDLHYWHDDAQVSCEHISKAYSTVTGIYIKIENIIWKS